MRFGVGTSARLLRDWLAVLQCCCCASKLTCNGLLHNNDLYPRRKMCEVIKNLASSTNGMSLVLNTETLPLSAHALHFRGKNAPQGSLAKFSLPGPLLKVWRNLAKSNVIRCGSESASRLQKSIKEHKPEFCSSGGVAQSLPTSCRFQDCKRA